MVHRGTALGDDGAWSSFRWHDSEQLRVKSRMWVLMCRMMMFVVEDEMLRR